LNFLYAHSDISIKVKKNLLNCFVQVNFNVSGEKKEALFSSYLKQYKAIGQTHSQRNDFWRSSFSLGVRGAEINDLSIDHGIYGLCDT
jgi:hypothetical protein